MILINTGFPPMPDLFVRFFDALYAMPLPQVTLWAALENLIIFTVTLVMGHFLVLRYQKHRVTTRPEPLTRVEILFAASCVALNTLVTVVGIMLWLAGIIRVRFQADWIGVLVDTLVLFFAMDLAMYVFHRVAHHP